MNKKRGYRGHLIYFDENQRTESGKWIPLSNDTGETASMSIDRKGDYALYTLKQNILVAYFMG